MRKATKARLERTGWHVGTASRGIRARRARQRLTQAEMARRLGSSQSQVAKMEAGDPSVSLDLLVRVPLRHGRDPQGTREDDHHEASLTD